MHLSGIWLQQFRSIEDKVWQFSPGRNVFVAPNGTGKSNLIEAIRLLSTGHSWRTRKTEELIAWSQELARIQGKVVKGDGEEVTLEQTLTHGQLAGRRTAQRTYLMNGVNKRQSSVVGELATVLFTPEEMEVFQAGPSARRRLLDEVLSQTDKQYRSALKNYEQALRRRNKLILQLRERQVDRYDFFYWDGLLIEHGGYIHEKRREFLHWLSEQKGIREPYQLLYDHSVVSEARLHEYAQAEVGAGHTLVGPHKDDIQILVERGSQWRDISVFGSRGEQRLSLLWFKLQEVEWLRQRLDDKPVLLLDDVFSELDIDNSHFLLGATTDLQAIITTVPGQEALVDEVKTL
jgi:DNA replication and repair protein RecF